jgi:hypothetical protein
MERVGIVFRMPTRRRHAKLHRIHWILERHPLSQGVKPPRNIKRKHASPEMLEVGVTESEYPECGG